jgi:hypothetical protein
MLAIFIVVVIAVAVALRVRLIEAALFVIDTAF